jgi:hypothetical protein
MSDLQAMILVMVGTVILSAALDVVLLLMGASGTALSLALALSLCVGSVVMTVVIKHYESAERRQRQPESRQT